MSWADAVLLFAMIWFVVLLVALALPFQTQGEKGDVVAGTPASAPARFNMRRRLLFTTVAALALFAVIYAMVDFNLIRPPGLGDVPTVPPLTDGGRHG